jgi:hypothetical protein
MHWKEAAQRSPNQCAYRIDLLGIMYVRDLCERAVFIVGGNVREIAPVAVTGYDDWEPFWENPRSRSEAKPAAELPDPKFSASLPVSFDGQEVGLAESFYKGGQEQCSD